jgi:hypothetical protein
VPAAGLDKVRPVPLSVAVICVAPSTVVVDQRFCRAQHDARAGADRSDYVAVDQDETRFAMSLW